MIFYFSEQLGSENCTHLLHMFINICRDLGVPLAQDKNEGPAEVITFLGIELVVTLM